MLNWSRPAKELERLFRAYFPWPGVFSINPEGQRLQFLEVEVIQGKFDVGLVYPDFIVGTGAGGFKIKRLKPEGKREMEASAYLSGKPSLVGKILFSTRISE